MNPETKRQRERMCLMAAALIALAAVIAWKLSGSATLCLALRCLALLALVAYAWFRRSLTAWIFVAMLIGAEVGHDLPGVATHLRVLALIYAHAAALKLKGVPVQPRSQVQQ